MQGLCSLCLVSLCQVQGEKRAGRNQIDLGFHILNQIFQWNLQANVMLTFLRKQLCCGPACLLSFRAAVSFTHILWKFSACLSTSGGRNQFVYLAHHSKMKVSLWHSCVLIERAHFYISVIGGKTPLKDRAWRVFLSALGTAAPWWIFSEARKLEGGSFVCLKGISHRLPSGSLVWL